MGQIYSGPQGSADVLPWEGFRFTDHLFAQIDGAVGTPWLSGVFTGGSVTRGLGEPDHPGIVRLNSGAGNGGAGVALQLTSGLSFQPFARSADSFYIEYMARFNTVPSAALNFNSTIGLANTFLTASLNQVTVTIILNGATPEFRLNTGGGGVVTTNFSGVSPVAGVWYRIGLQMLQNEANLLLGDLTTDPVVIATNTTNLPTGTMTAFFNLGKSAGAANANIDFDYVFIAQDFA